MLKTIAIEERPGTGLGCYYGAIVDTYLYGGALYKDYGESSKFFKMRTVCCIKAWRLIDSGQIFLGCRI